MTKSMDKIADLLPEGLDEGTLVKIADLVNNKISEEVESRVNDLSIKVNAFIRGQIDSLKEQAMKELELENNTFRNAQLFENMKSMFVTELTPEDEINATNLMALEAQNLENQKTVLVSELDRQLQENVKLKNMVSVQNKKLRRLEESLEEQKRMLEEETSARDAMLSDSALVVSVENFQRKGKEIQPKNPTPANKVGARNQFLTEDILNLMK